MTDMVNIEMYNNLMIENELLKKINIELEEKLKTYTNTERNKKYYEKNSEKVKDKAKTYIEKMKTEKIKEWRHTAYMNRKNKLENNN